MKKSFMENTEGQRANAREENNKQNKTSGCSIAVMHAWGGCNERATQQTRGEKKKKKQKEKTKAQ